MLQQAQARDTALMNDPLSSEAILTHDMTDSQAPIAVASVDQLEPVMIESNTSQAVTTTLVSDDEEDDHAIEASGKDAIDVPSQGASPLLLLGGVALIGGGIAVLTNDDSNSTTVNDDSYSTTVPEFHLEGIATLGHTLSVSGKYDSKDRTGGTIASVLFLLSQGVQIFRVHNVNEVRQGILVFKKILSM